MNHRHKVRVTMAAGVGLVLCLGWQSRIIAQSTQADGLSERQEPSVTDNKPQSGLARTPWAKFGGNAANAGRGGEQAIKGAKPWMFAMLTKRVVSPPALGADGTVFVSGVYLQALDGASGRCMWELPSVSVNTGGAIIDAQGTVYISGQTGYYGSSRYSIYALDGKTGKAHWAFPMPHAATNTPALGANGALYVQCSDGKLYAIDCVTGKQRWVFALSEPVFSDPKAFKTVLPVVAGSPTVGPDGTVYTSCDRLYAVDGETGKLKWVFGSDRLYIGNSPAIDSNGVLYIGAGFQSKSWVVAVDSVTGQQKWSFPTEGSTIYTPPALDADGTVYAGSADGSLYALEAETGTLKWRFTTKGPITCSAAVGADHTIYFGSYDHTFYALNGNTGKQKWTTALGDVIAFSPALAANGFVYVVTQNGLVYALNTIDGAKSKLSLLPR